MKKKYVKTLVATVAIAATAIVTPLAIYAHNNSDHVSIATDNEIIKTNLEDARTIYLGVNTPISIKDKLLAKVTDPATKTIDGIPVDKIQSKDIKITVKSELLKDNDTNEFVESDSKLNNLLTRKNDTITFSREGYFVGEITIKEHVHTVIFDIDNSMISFVDLNDWAVIINTKNPNFMEKEWVTFDSNKIKMVQVSTAKVQLDKAGDYMITYVITGTDNKIVKKNVLVTVGDQDKIKELEQMGVWIAVDQNIEQPMSESVVQKPGSTVRPEQTPAGNKISNGSSSTTEHSNKPVEQTPVTPQHQHHWNTGKVTKVATCTEAGEKSYVCMDCHEIKTESIPALGHHMTDWEIVTNATCTTEGSKERHCTECGMMETQIIPTLTHKWNEGIVTKEPTCETDGVKTYTCENCQETKTETIKALGHDLKEIITKEPTCGEAGTKEITCTRCDHKETVEIPATGNHTWNEGIVTKEPTCETDGIKTFTCNDCQETKTKTIKALGHDLKEIITKEPTCGEAGTKEITCTRCDHKETVEIPATGKHTWNEGIVTKEPTCETDGIKTFTCNDCQETKTETIKALGHDLKETITKEPTCGEAGMKTVQCTRCGHTESNVEIPATGKHTYDNGVITTQPTCTTAGVKTFTCTECGHTKVEVVPATGHHMDNGTITKQPTCTEAGEKTYHCEHCDYTETETISMIDHVWESLFEKQPDKEVTEWHAICGGCGKDFGPGEAGAQAALEHIMMNFGDACENYHSEPVQVTIPGETIEVGHKCTVCGKEERY